MAKGARVYAFPAERMLELEPWVTRKHLAQHFGVTTRTITNYVQAGMPSLKLKGERRFKISACERWMRDRGWETKSQHG